jgi:3-hydroxyacyl-[acyl-carrier-protein] dehydratase
VSEQPLFDHARIRAILPQRYPLLLVDQVLELQPGSFIRTIKAVTATEPCFADTPEEGLHEYPRSLIIESLGQSSALLWLADHPVSPDDDRVLMFAGARDFRFEGSAYPGDVMRHDVRLDGVVADTAFASGETWVGRRRIATVSAMIATRRPVQPSGAQPFATSADGGRLLHRYVLERITMTQTADLQLEELREMVAEVLELEPEELTDEGDFTEDYKADSLRAIEILARIDKRYKVEIPQTELPSLRNLRAVHEALVRHSS